MMCVCAPPPPTPVHTGAAGGCGCTGQATAGERGLGSVCPPIPISPRISAWGSATMATPAVRSQWHGPHLAAPFSSQAGLAQREEGHPKSKGMQIPGGRASCQVMSWPCLAPTKQPITLESDAWQ